ncbi:NRDE family protein [candidate division KSB1 bacterium]|nr:NRDE family protein [candidate division KSB1 bacterium]
MCTVTWLQRHEGYEVFCNRDELKTRKPALPPRLAECNGVRYLAPIDNDGGGSWLGVNEFGVSLCLVNHYPNANGSAHVHDKKIPPLREARGVLLDHQTTSQLNGAVAPHNTPLNPLKGGIKTPFTGGISKDEKFRSRGLLLTSLMDCVSTDIFAQRLCHEALEQYRPFILLAFDLNDYFFIAQWDGLTLQRRQLKQTDLPVTSSSFATEDVVSARKEYFATLAQFPRKIDNTSFPDFHRSHIPERGAYSVCMHRDDAETVSFSHVHVTNAEVAFRYFSAAPCTVTEPECLRLRITQAAPVDSFSVK